MLARRHIVRTAALLALAALAPACLAGPGSEAGSLVEGRGTACEMSLQASSFAGTCGELVLHNTGHDAMSGWDIAFDLPAGGHLVSGWNATFAVQGQHVTVSPIGKAATLAADGSLSIGYCATGAAEHVAIHAGACGA